ncbi:hypothetical protein P7K49_033436 [Saguinus oedipus]|uniref:NADH dehydrogenase [ubiquinone] 1 beta subcomplex subunit 7 n=1 Tax=Saguinus oedipus TaxID=9490 RepID=A0ABQ9TRX3_SAGOE|nr:hypothetical protein P7K49_033436 [Saguinus oedipus]
MVATQQEMMDAQLRLQLRDYCAHYLIRLLKCKRDNFPNILACKHERHDWEYCEHRDQGTSGRPCHLHRQTPDPSHRHTGLSSLEAPPVLWDNPSTSRGLEGGGHVLARDLTVPLALCPSYVIRMKEFERERRLLERERRLLLRKQQREKKAAAELAKGQGPGKVAPEVAL